MGSSPPGLSPRVAFGDFQTSPALAEAVAALLREIGVTPRSILEPTCGTGHLLLAAMSAFAEAETVSGYDINPNYVRRVQAQVEARRLASQRVDLRQADFFEIDWPAVVSSLPKPILVIGNPPWVTNSALSATGIPNLPGKSNFDEHRGLDAITGKSNFDISEWMLWKLLEALHTHEGAMAVLCKTSVARKLLTRATRKGLRLSHAAMFLIDAQAHFGASVDACLLYCATGATSPRYDCDVFSGLNLSSRSSRIGYRDGALVSDLDTYDRLRDLRGESQKTWRSGIKHDCSKVMELRREDGVLLNGLGEVVSVEETCIYPLLKGSDVFHGRVTATDRLLLVTQQSIGENTTALRKIAPHTWMYLEAHAEAFGMRRSSIYADKTPYSIFGVGPYTFASWKVAVSGLHKEPHFRLVGPIDGKPVVFDDTCYFIPCETRQEATVLHAALDSQVARSFYRAMMFSDAKRPVTKALLQHLDLVALIRVIGEDRLAAEWAGVVTEMSESVVHRIVSHLRPAALQLFPG